MERERQTDRQTGKQTDRDRERERDRETSERSFDSSRGSAEWTFISGSAVPQHRGHINLGSLLVKELL